MMARQALHPFASPFVDEEKENESFAVPPQNQCRYRSVVVVERREISISTSIVLLPSPRKVFRKEA